MNIRFSVSRDITKRKRNVERFEFVLKTKIFYFLCVRVSSIEFKSVEVTCSIENVTENQVNPTHCFMTYRILVVFT